MANYIKLRCVVEYIKGKVLRQNGYVCLRIRQKERTIFICYYYIHISIYSGECVLNEPQNMNVSIKPI